MTKYLLLIAASMMFFTSCRPYSLVNSETYDNADLKAYSTFRIIAPDDTARLPKGMEMNTYCDIAAAIREQMFERGYREDPSSPLLINLGVTVTRHIDSAPALPPGYTVHAGPSYTGCYPVFMYPRRNYWSADYADDEVIGGIYKEGVLTIDLVNTVSNTPLYTASVATITTTEDTDQPRFRDHAAISEAARTLFSHFPVTPL